MLALGLALSGKRGQMSLCYISLPNQLIKLEKDLFIHHGNLCIKAGNFHASVAVFISLLLIVSLLFKKSLRICMYLYIMGLEQTKMKRNHHVLGI